MVTLSPAAAVDALREELTGGFDPASDQERQKVALPHGEMHLLPSALDGAVGVKVLGIQPTDSDVDVPFIQGSYLLMGGKTLTPEWVIDAAALTTLRTPAVSVAGVVDLMWGSSEPLGVVIFGTGAQGVGHAETIADVLDGVREVSFTSAVGAEILNVRYGDGPRMFEHVLVGEAQDFNAGHWHFLRACVAEGRNDIFIAEDSHQRIYGNPLTLSHFGISTRGRVQKTEMVAVW